ncbi:MAG TPA: DNA polymerase III subunit alpha [Vicinamibacterales bacterium]|nr:DNA polymerase III subunit alpha [Vicinamibacterales bacterium]
MYIELHAASAFSFLDGASLPEALVDRAASLGYPALALLDRDGVYGSPRFHLAAKKAGLKAIIGAELTMTTRASSEIRRPVIASAAPAIFKLPVLVESQAGYRNLCRLVTAMKLRSPKGEGALSLDELDGQTSGLIALAGRAMLSGHRFGVGGLVDRLVGIFGRANVYLELQRHLLRDEEADNHALRDLAAAFHLPLVATNGVRFAEPASRPLYDVLTCIRHKTTIERAGRRLTCNAERYLKPPAQMAALFADLPETITASRDLADRLSFTMADLGYRFPRYPVPDGESMASFLRSLTLAGARERYRPLEAPHTRQLERELHLIEKLDLAGYFLIVWDIVNFCRQQGVLVQGRGSAANSAVCYSLGITAVDPIGMDLLFERFLSEERGEWPDIDLDLPSGDRRERVIQHVYEKYGRFGAAMTANVITYRGRSAAREVGKVLGLEPPQVDALAKVMNQFEWIDPKETLERNLREAGMDALNPTIQVFGRLWTEMQDLPRHLGQHSGGMVMCQGRLDEVVPLENASMPGRVVIQWDKDDCADMGIVKVDLLGLGMMAVLQDALEIVNSASSDDRCSMSDDRRSMSDGRWSMVAQPLTSDLEPRASRLPPPPSLAPPASRLAPRASPLDLAHLPPHDPAVYRMLQEADTIGIFQVESRAQMATLPRLRPNTFYDIVVEVAIIRPGPIVGQMVHPYLKRRQGQEPVAYPHPSLQPILERTLGVPLFQEQLLRMAMVAAGFSGGEAEELRRAFGFKRSERRMQEIEKKLRAGMAKQGITDEPAEEIIRSITSFALYGFPESHAASFALLVYASAYLKAHYPAAFYTAMLNNQPMGFYHPSTLVKDAQRHGVRFAPIDVQVSDWTCRVETDGRVRLGLMYVNGLRRDVGEAIEARGARREVGGERRVSEIRCPKCGCDDQSMVEALHTHEAFCNVCSHVWPVEGSISRVAPRPSPLAPRFSSLDDFIRRTGIRRDEVATLASIGALNAFGFDRRTALWQIEQAIRPAGELFEEACNSDSQLPTPNSQSSNLEPPASRLAPPASRLAPAASRLPPPASPLAPMTVPERLLADYAGTSLTIGPHPMSLRRSELALRGVLRASDLPLGRHGRRVRVAGAVITRQRPGTAKGFVFLTLEDETGIANIIVRPDLFAEQRAHVVGAPYLLVEGTLQIQEGVTSVRAERVHPLGGASPPVDSHDFR